MEQEQFEELINFLKEKKIKGRHFAKWIGVSPVTFSKWNNGKCKPSPLLVVVFDYLKLLDQIGVDIEDKIKIKKVKQR